MELINNKLKIINDPVYGLIKIPFPIIHDLIQHWYFQRLREIKQLGLTSMVYPGAVHNRFQHSLGAMHLMKLAISNLRQKNIKITQEEEIGVLIAILLHDIGHGPFSHVLENVIIEDISHEEITYLYMNRLNEEFNGQLTLAIQIFKDEYPKRFLHQLVSSQLDMDRLDYLKRDSFYTGVTEGNIGSDRIIKMLHVFDDKLVIESKGIYSIEKFLIARRLMYWQVYLHKTSVVSELILINVLKRAKYLLRKGYKLFGTSELLYFLSNNISKNDFFNDKEVMNKFSLLADNDILSAIKMWITSDDFILSTLSANLIYRRLPYVELGNKKYDNNFVSKQKEKIAKKYKLKNINDADYFVNTEIIENHAYSIKNDHINIIYKDGSIKDISDASDILNISVLGKNVKKHVLYYPKPIH